MRLPLTILFVTALAPLSALAVPAQSPKPGGQAGGEVAVEKNDGDKRHPLLNPLLWSLALVGGRLGWDEIVARRNRQGATPGAAAERPESLQGQVEELPPQDSYVRRRNSILFNEFFRRKKDQAVIDAHSTCTKGLLNDRDDLPLRVQIKAEAQCWNQLLDATRPPVLSTEAQAELAALHAEYERDFPGGPFPRDIDALLPGQESVFRTAARGDNNNVMFYGRGTHDASQGRSNFDRIVKNSGSVGDEITRRLRASHSFFGGRAPTTGGPKRLFKLPAVRLR